MRENNPHVVFASPTLEKKKNKPEAVITKGTIIGEINKAIIGRRSGISLEAKPMAAKVPKAVEIIVAQKPIKNELRMDLIYCALLQISDHQPITAVGSTIPF